MTRFALVPASVLDDHKLSCTHLRLLLALSSAPANLNGWCRCEPEELGETAGEPRPDGTIEPIPPDEVLQLLEELRAWGYVAVRVQHSTGKRAYRLNLDLPPEGKGA